MLYCYFIGFAIGCWFTWWTMGRNWTIAALIAIPALANAAAINHNSGPNLVTPAYNNPLWYDANQVAYDQTMDYNGDWVANLTADAGLVVFPGYAVTSWQLRRWNGGAPLSTDKFSAMVWYDKVNQVFGAKVWRNGTVLGTIYAATTPDLAKFRFSDTALTTNHATLACGLVLDYDPEFLAAITGGGGPGTDVPEDPTTADPMGEIPDEDSDPLPTGNWIEDFAAAIAGQDSWHTTLKDAAVAEGTGILGDAGAAGGLDTATASTNPKTDLKLALTALVDPADLETQDWITGFSGNSPGGLSTIVNIQKTGDYLIDAVTAFTTDWPTLTTWIKYMVTTWFLLFWLEHQLKFLGWAFGWINLEWISYFNPLNWFGSREPYGLDTDDEDADIGDQILEENEAITDRAAQAIRMRNGAMED